MKEKIQLVILIVVFVVALIFVNNMLNKNALKENNQESVNENISTENTIIDIFLKTFCIVIADFINTSPKKIIPFIIQKKMCVVNNAHL